MGTAHGGVDVLILKRQNADLKWLEQSPTQDVAWISTGKIAC